MKRVQKNGKESYLKNLFNKKFAYIENWSFFIFFQKKIYDMTCEMI